MHHMGEMIVLWYDSNLVEVEFTLDGIINCSAWILEFRNDIFAQLVSAIIYWNDRHKTQPDQNAWVFAVGT